MSTSISSFPNSVWAEAVMKRGVPDFALLEALRDEGVDMEAETGYPGTPSFMTPLRWAVEYQNTGLLQWLLTHVAVPEVQPNNLLDPVFAAVESEWEEGALLLIAKKPVLSDRGAVEMLRNAIHRRQQDFAIAMIDLGYPWHAADQTKPLIAAAAGKDCARVVQHLHEKGADLHVRWGAEAAAIPLPYPLTAETLEGHGTDTLRYLLENGLPADDAEVPPAALAAMHGRSSALRVLLDHGANPNAMFLGKPMLHHALTNLRQNCTQMLLHHGTDTRPFLPSASGTHPVGFQKIGPLPQLWIKDHVHRLHSKQRNALHRLQTAPEGIGELSRLLFMRGKHNAATPLLRQWAGAGMLEAFFTPDLWQGRESEARTLAARIRHALPPFSRAVADAIDLSWAQPELEPAHVARLAASQRPLHTRVR